MVYRERPTHLYIIFVFFCAHTTFFCYKNQLYLTYILGLNYWSTNTTFILMLFALFIKRLSTYSLWPVITLIFKLTELTPFFFKKKLITTLIVGTVVIHPLAFYVFTAIFFVKFFTRNVYQTINLIRLSLKILAVFLMLTLILGGFWGLQSISWGYFWVNDAIEWLLLIKIIYLLYVGHIFKAKPLVCNQSLVPAIILGLLVFVRLNLIQTRHNFISSQPLVYTVLIFYMVLLTLTFSAAYSCFQGQSATCARYAIILFLIGFSLYFYATLFFKYSWTILLLYYVQTYKPGNFKRLVYIHFLVLTFFTVWLLYFNFFHLYYVIDTQLTTATSVIYEHSLFRLFQYSTSNTLTALEGVVFSLFSEATHYVNLLQNLDVHVLLNNSSLIYLLILVFFFCKMSWI